jgi:hypothetical protein
MKKGDIWISAVLYMALGIIVIALILAASLPLIEKIKDRNTVAETKNLLLSIDESIKTVAKEGPGSQRELSSLIIKKGQLDVRGTDDTITWQLKTSAPLMEPDIPLKEGVLHLELKSTPVVDEYLMTISLEYENLLDLVLDSPYQSPFMGQYSGLVLHNGTFSIAPDGSNVPAITVRIQ